MTSPKETHPELERQIVENLRRVYNETLEEAVPERFLDLLRQLKDQDGSEGGVNG
ncbi:NepR family anti-sigma factor [Frigidibacter sp. ROC022]|uniref:NepR family anti-sigma factor n=1 Tax=Frigidibacter sp. ROC022 TaxID=2971796 RepID=UPI00215B5BFD|nr:NepR family anti-sigma factor [Frigidibacter sp. ROC022]MCR8723862.1 NepR family anti-sigma factor [Frigidibacter sp. ROC022]